MLDENAKLKQMIREEIKKVSQTSGFTDRKLTDTPTDVLQVVNKRFVTNNGAVANRPRSSVASLGQPYLATDTGIPMTYTAAGWVNGVGSIVALNN